MMMTNMAVRFGDCELSLERLELRRADQIVGVEPQVFDVLSYLLRHRDRVVPKTELLDQIWGDRFVSETALSSRIKSARQAIGDTGRDQRIIKTIHGRGYRFVADVAEKIERPSRGLEPANHDADADVDPASRLLRAINDVSDGAGAAFDIIGTPRSGKTQLLHKVATAARRTELAVGMSRPMVTNANPYACVAQALDEMAQQYPELLGLVPPTCRSELERAFAGRLPTTRQRWLVSVREFLIIAAEHSGAALLLDDLHLAHGELMAVIGDLAGLSRHHRLVVVIAHHEEVSAPAGFEIVALPERGHAFADQQAILGLPAEATDALRKLAVVGDRFDRLEFLAALDADIRDGDRVLELALGSGVLICESGECRFVDPAAAHQLAEEVARPLRPTVKKDIAVRLADLGAAPARVADRLLAAGEPDMAAPYALAAARAAAAAGLHGQVLRWTDAVRRNVSGSLKADLLSLRADALAAVGDHAAVAVYRQALAAAVDPGQEPGLRARLARAAILTGDLASAEEALAGLEASGGPDDAGILLARGMLAYFSGDLDSADAAVEAARPLALTPGAPDRLLDVITLQGMIAHNRGRWFDRLGRELRATQENPQLASTVFDSHLCVAEYLLYGPTPYDEVLDLARQLREQAERVGARRGVAFAVTVAGEAALLAGDLDAAGVHLNEAVALHMAMGADTGTAHTLQRLAEVELADGDRAKAERLLRRALPLARWSPLARHLLPRVYGSLIAAAPDTDAALAVVDEAVEVLDGPFACMFCQVMIAVPASIACVEGGRMDEARDWLAQATRSAGTWQGTAWQGAVTESRAYLARAEGDLAGASRLFTDAANHFATAGQSLDARRCLEAVDS
jgi:DNA-binding winged helix-turn-helix (wHTH) protein